LDFFGGMNYFWARRKFFMNPLIRQTILLAGLLAGIFGVSARAQNLDQIGVTLLRTQTTNLDGSGIRVAQPEANTDSNTNHPSAFEVNPAAVSQSTNRFTYFSAAGIANTFTNTAGNESGHADGVAANFYGLTGNGVATNVAHVDNYDADFFITNYVFNLVAMPTAAVVNQSFTFGALTVTDQQAVDSAYDDYSESFGVLFISAANNGGSVRAPGTSYNCICVAAYGGSSSTGPTLDNGRCKPDITAPSGVTSFSTPQVSGAAAVLMQAALRGDGGSDTNAAFDLRTIKALLLNGAVKPANWTNSNSSPLDARYGTGVLNVFNSYKQLAGGKNNSSATDLISIGAAHPPIAATNLIAVTSGWNLETIFSTPTNDAVSHYFFNATNGFITATLAWNRQLGETNINDLDLFLYDCANSNLVVCSTSRVDNVEHIFVPRLAAGRYDLQVLKNGGTNVVSDGETYAMAFAFAPTHLSLTSVGTNAVLTWPIYPAGFCVAATTNLAAPTWSTNNFSATLTGSTNILTLPMTNAAQFFRLRHPNF
jgi:hypothetical protein